MAGKVVIRTSDGDREYEGVRRVVDMWFGRECVEYEDGTSETVHGEIIKRDRDVDRDWASRPITSII